MVWRAERAARDSVNVWTGWEWQFPGDEQCCNVTFQLQRGGGQGSVLGIRPVADEGDDVAGLPRARGGRLVDDRARRIASGGDQIGLDKAGAPWLSVTRRRTEYVATVV